jgi:exosortase/archaeosortase family protein
MKEAVLQNISMPGHVKKLLIKALLLFAGWMFLYQLWLKPLGIPDNIFTQTVATGAEKLLLVFIDDIKKVGSSIFVHGVRSVNIASQCNGLELIALYIGILICLPGAFKRKMIYSVAGIAGITVLNIIRCALLAWMYYQKMPLTDFAHHYAFKIIIYLFAFGGWFLYSKNLKFNEKTT